jgi:hypothetical protein
MKTILAITAVFVAASAWSDGQAPVTFSGKGKNAIEVRDSSGQVTEVIGTSKLRLNQIPAEAVVREEAYRAKQKELAENVNARRAENAAAEEKAATEAAEAAKKADAEAIAAAAAESKKYEEEHPRKVRRTTVRGNRYVPKPESAAGADPAPAQEKPEPAQQHSDAPAAKAAPDNTPSPR